MSTPSLSSALHNGTFSASQMRKSKLACDLPWREKVREANDRTRYLFNGKELDTETNLYYYGARYFEPNIALWYGVDPLAGEFPFNSGYVYCNGNPIRYVDLWGENPTEEEAARMSAHAYGDLPDDVLIGGWKVSKKAEELGIPLTNEKSGFKSQLYERTNASGDTEYVYAFAGTDFSEANDWLNDVGQLVGLSSQYSIAKENAEQLKSFFGNNLSFTGHSLGGGMAAYASSVTNLPAMTFNAAKVSPYTNTKLLPALLLQEMTSQPYLFLAEKYSYRNVDAYVNFFDELRLLEGNPNGNIHYRLNRAKPLGHSIENFYAPGIIEKSIGKAKIIIETFNCTLKNMVMNQFCY